jgi:hypothetical protein
MEDAIKRIAASHAGDDPEKESNIHATFRQPHGIDKASIL